MTEFCSKQLPELGLSLDYYIISGASKRGWTTWLVGAVDPKRVKAIIPIVLDAINFVEFAHHQYKSYNGWAEALTDYVDMNIMNRIDTLGMRALQEQEDPYFFRERLTMPKLIINAAMDEFQQPDDSFFWYDGLPEGQGKWLVMTPNAEHSLSTGILEVVPVASAWISAIIAKEHVPKFHWTIDGTGAVTATLDALGVVDEVNAWYSYSCGVNNNTTDIRRDYRAVTLDAPCNCGVASGVNCLNLKTLWTKVKLEEVVVNNKKTYSYHRDAPEQGWVAYFIEVRYKSHKPLANEAVVQSADDSATRLTNKLQKAEDLKKLSYKLSDFPFPTDFKGDLVFTTQVSIFPQTYPFADCVGTLDAGDAMCSSVLR